MLRRANKYMVRRGPDNTNVVKVGPVVMMHNLLHISGSIAQVQPVSDQGQNVFALFNGEIYNFRDVAQTGGDCDTECVIPGYFAHGSTFTQRLDGEFAIVVYDREKKRVVVSSDVFMTKPLYISVGADELGIATYPSALTQLGFREPVMYRPNTIQVYDVSDLQNIRLAEEHPVRRFALEQFKTDMVDWEKAFLDAVKKRATHGVRENNMFLCLSSGYDSGAIALGMNLQGLPYTTYTTYKNENEAVLNARFSANDGCCVQRYAVKEIGDGERAMQAMEIEALAEPFVYVHDDMPGSGAARLKLSEDGGARALNYICREMSGRGYRIVLSGSGADEILSDYGFRGQRIYPHSQFGGLFPEDLSAIFPWHKFYGDTQRSYLFKDEFVAGVHHIEGRYPFLDVSVVQEYLSLAHTVKNATYKAPIAWFLKKHAYPMEENVKKGFAI